jgi:hypothetical protein
MPDGLDDWIKKNAGLSTKLDPDTVARTVDDEAANLGWSDNARLALLSNLGRENSWDANTIFAGHKDPANSADNLGIISWQKDRRKDLVRYMNENGGTFEPNEQNLRLMMRFADNEMQNSSDPRVTEWRDLNKRLKSPDVTPDEAYQALQRYIQYQPQYEGANRSWEKKALPVVQNNSIDRWIKNSAAPEKTADDWIRSQSDTGPGPAPAPTNPNGATLRSPVPSTDTVPPQAVVVDAPLNESPDQNYMQQSGILAQTPEQRKQNALQQREKTSQELQRAKTPARRNILIKRIRDLNEQITRAEQEMRAARNANPANIAPLSTQAPETDIDTMAEQASRSVNQLGSIGVASKLGEKYQEGDQPTDLILRHASAQKFRSQPSYRAYSDFVAASGGKYTEGSPESIEAFNAEQKTRPPSAVKRSAVTLPVSNPQPAKPAQSSSPETGDDADSDNASNFERAVPFRDKPADVDNTDWLIRQVVPEIAAKTKLEPADIERYLKKGIRHFSGTRLEDVSREGFYKFKWTPEDTDVVSAMGAAKYDALNQLVASGQDFDKKQAALDLDIDPQTIDEATSGKYDFADVYKQGQAKKQQFKESAEKNRAALQPDEPESVAQLKAMADVGWIDPAKADDAIKTEKTLYKRLVDENTATVAQGKSYYPTEERQIVANNANARETVQALLQQYGTLANYQKTQDDLREKYRYRPLAAPIEFAKRFANAVPQAVSSLLKSTAIAEEIASYPTAKLIDYVTGSDIQKMFRASDNPVYKLGKQFGDYFDGLKNKDFDQDKLITIGADSLGQITVQILSGIATGGATLPTAIGATMGAVQQYEDAAKFTDNPEMRLFAAVAGAAAAVPDALAFNKWLGGLDGEAKTTFLNKLAKGIYARLGIQYGDEAAEKLTRVTLETWAKNILKGSTFEGLQEVSENKINDAVALATYDRSEARQQKLLSINDEDVASFLGGVVGGGLGGGVETKIEAANDALPEKAKTSLPELLRTKSIDQETSDKVSALIDSEIERRKITTSKQKQSAAVKPATAKAESDLPVTSAESAPEEDLAPTPSEAKVSRPVAKNEILEPGTTVTVAGKGAGVVVSDEGKNALIDYNPKPGRNGDTVYQSRTSVRKKDLQIADTAASATSTSTTATPVKPAVVTAAIGAAVTGTEPAHDAATSPNNDLPEPTQAQKEAGNYQKGHIKINGLDISVENPVGSKRSGVSPEGVPWSVTMNQHYGYIKRTVGADVEHIDTFVKDGTPADFNGQVYVVDQVEPETGKFDEHKVMLGYDDIEAAKFAYLSNYDKDWTGLDHITPMSMQEFKTWAYGAQATVPVHQIFGDKSATIPADARPSRKPKASPRNDAQPSEIDAGTPAGIEAESGQTVAEVQPDFFHEGRPAKELNRQGNNVKIQYLDGGKETPTVSGKDLRPVGDKVSKKVDNLPPKQAETEQKTPEIAKLRKNAAPVAKQRGFKFAKAEPVQSELPLRSSRGQRETVEIGDHSVDIIRKSGLAPERAKIQEAAVDALVSDPQKFVDEYYRRYGKQIVNADRAKALFPEWERDPLENDSAVHAAGSALARLIFEKRLSELPAGSNIVLTAGGQASGKSTAIENTDADLVYDSVMSSVDGNRAVLDKIADAGDHAAIIYVYRPIKQAAVAMLERLAAHRRPVSASGIASGHFYSQQAFVDDTDGYARSKGFSVRYVEVMPNRQTRDMTLGELRKRKYNTYEEAKSDAEDAIRTELESGDYAEPIRKYYEAGLRDETDKGRAQESEDSDNSPKSAPPENSEPLKSSRLESSDNESDLPNVFYSSAAKVIGEKMPNRADVKAVEAILRNDQRVKDLDPELQMLHVWLGDQAGPVTKTDVLAFLRANQVRVQDIVLADTGIGEGRIDSLNNGKFLVHYPGLQDVTVESRTEAETRLRKLRGQFADDGANAGYPRFERAGLTLPGEYENYKEEFVVAPPNEQSWNDGHAEYENIENPIARLRYDDRTTVDGKSMLFAEEIQQPNEYNFAKMPKVYQKYGELIGIKKLLYRAAAGGYDVLGLTTGEQQAERYSLARVVDSIKFSTNLSGQKLVRLNVNKGSQHFDLEFVVGSDGIVMNASEDSFNGKGLNEVVGKGIARKILDEEKGEIAGEGLKVGGLELARRYDVKIVDAINKYLRPWGVKVAETILPADVPVVVSHGAGHFVEVGDTMHAFKDLERARKFALDSANSTVHSVEITPEMRTAFLEGQPLFRARDAATESAIDKVEGADLKRLTEKSDVSDLKRDGYRIETKSPEIYELVRRAVEEHADRAGSKNPQRFDALYLDPDQVKSVSGILRDGAVDAVNSGLTATDAAKLESIAKTIDDAADAGQGSAIVYLFDDALPHEEFHKAGYDQAVDKQLARRHSKESLKALVKTEAVQKLRSGAFKSLYPRASDAVAVEETAAWLIGGGREKLNTMNRDLGVPEITEGEAVGFLKNWLWSFKQQNPDANLDEFAKINDYANRIVEHTRDIFSRDQNESSGRSSGSNEGRGESRRNGVNDPGDNASERGSPAEKPDSGNGKLKERQTVLSAEEAGVVPEGSITGRGRYYQEKSRQANERDAQSRIEQVGLARAVHDAVLIIPEKTRLAEHKALQMEVAKLLNKQADEATSVGNLVFAKAKLQSAQEVVAAMAEQGTDYGQAISQLANWQKTDPDAVTGYVQKRRNQKGYPQPLTPEESKVLRDDATKVRELEDKNLELEKHIADLESRLATKKTRNPVQREVAKKLKAAAAESLKRLKDKFEAPDAALKMARPLSEMRTQQLDEDSLKDFAAVGADILMSAEKGKPLTLIHFEHAMADIFGSDIHPHVREIFALSRDELKRAKSEAYRARAIEALQSVEDNTDLTIEDLNAIVEQRIAERLAAAKLRGQQTREANEFFRERAKAEKLDQMPSFAKSLFKVADVQHKEELVGALYLETGQVNSADELARKLREVFPELSAREALNTASVAARSRKLAHEDLRAERQRLREVSGKAKSEQSEIKRQRNQAQRQLLRRIQYLESPPPSYSARIARVYKAALVGAVQTTVNNFLTAEATRKLVTVTDLTEALLNRALAKVGAEYDYDNKTGSKMRMRDILGIPDGRHTVPGALKHYFSDAVFARSLANSVLDEYPTAWEKLFGSYASDIEVARDLPGGKGLADKAMQGIEKVYEGVNYLNYLQEFLVRSQEFNHALQMKIGERGLDLSTVVKEGTIVENLTAEDLAYAVHRALRVTFAMRADPSTFTGALMSGYQKHTPALLAPLGITFPNFLHNAVQFVTDYMPVAGLVKAGIRTARSKDSLATAYVENMNPRVIAQQGVGMVMLMAAYALVSAFGDDDKWYYLRTPFADANGKHYYIDVRGYQPFAPMVFVANKLNRVNSGKPMFTDGDAIVSETMEALTGLSSRSLTENKVAQIFWYLGKASVQRDDEQDWARFGHVLKQELGEIVGGFLRPLKTVKDLAAQFSERESRIPETGDSPFVQGVARVVPFSNTLFGLEPRKDFATGKEQRQPAPGLKVFGVSIVDPNLHREAPSPALSLIRDLTDNNKPDRDVLPSAQRQAAVKSSLYRAMREAGDDAEKQEKVNEAIRRAEDEGILRRGQLEFIERGQGLTELESLAKGAELDKVERVYKIATDKEKALLDPILETKRENREKEIENAEFERTKDDVRSGRLSVESVEKDLDGQLEAGKITAAQYQQKLEAMYVSASVEKAADLGTSTESDFRKIESFIKGVRDKDREAVYNKLLEKVAGKLKAKDAKSQREAERLMEIVEREFPEFK